MRATNEQKDRWNGSAGDVWVENRDLLDAMFAPIAALLAGAVRPADRVLDIGCGTGATTLAVAAAVGPRGAATGIDLSQAMVAVARARAAEQRAAARFVAADAERHRFPAEAFDAVVSRFGVMFFADPVAAFANVRRAARTGAEATLVAWRDAEANPFMTTAERATAALVPDFAALAPGPSGQFAFGAPGHVRSILEDAGWSAVDIAPLDVACTFPAADLARYVTRMGPTGRVLAAMEPAAAAELTAALLAAFASYVEGDAVRFTAACWTIRARA